MKSFILNIFLSVIFLTNTQAQHFTLNCTSQAITDKSRAILKVDGKADTLTYKDSKLAIAGPCNFVGRVQLELDYEGDHEKAHLYNFFLSEGCINLNIMDVTGLDRPEVTGNKNAVDYEYQLRRPVNEMNIQIRKTGRLVNEVGGLQSEGAKNIQKVLEQQVYDCFHLPVKYINANPDSPVSIEALYMMGKGNSSAKIAPADLEVLFASLSPDIRSSQAGLKYAEKLHKMLSE